jgi:hypothetical protein
MLGGSTNLNFNGISYEGDLSGIQTSQIPFWFQPFYKPGTKIAQEKDWAKKLDDIVLKAKDWDIGCVAGVPAWIQILLEKIIAHYKLKHIHEIWPNLSVYGHGGVSFEPYRKAFDKLVGKPLIYLETYLASEGFIAYQDRQYPEGMKLVLNEHIYFEFVPFDETNFSNTGDLVEQPVSLSIDEIEEGKEYALLMSTSAGAWRYLIGDTVKFVNKERSEIIITGRTKHFLSLVGEHLSVDNMNKAIKVASEQLNINCPEFTVAGFPIDRFFGHHWYIACNDQVDPLALTQLIDSTLKDINDDYAIERKSALKDIVVEVLPEHVFMDFMEKKGKVGGQHKFPRVLKGKLLEEWKEFINQIKH